MVKLLAFVVLVALLLFGCAVEHFRPVTDASGSRGNYAADIADCRQLAGVSPPTVSAASPHGDNGAPVAPRDAADGEIARLADVVTQQQTIVVRCMAGRGYNVAAQ